MNLETIAENDNTIGYRYRRSPIGRETDDRGGDGRPVGYVQIHSRKVPISSVVPGETT